jgi:signal transduction histidine kinase
MSDRQANPPLAEQLVELSALTGGLAHEIRNPLSTLKVNLQLLNEEWGTLETGDIAGREAQDIARRSRKRISTLLEEADRLERILGDFLRYVSRRDLKLAPCDVAALIRDLADFYRPQAELHGIDLRAQTPDDPLVCNIDAHFIKQAVLNLLINGQQAMHEGGVLELNVAAEGSDHVRVDVRDQGAGIPPDQHEAVFRAYYSTKKGGTGLGLATARQIIREHRGQIRVSSEPPNGSCFTILLPYV